MFARFHMIWVAWLFTETLSCLSPLIVRGLKLTLILDLLTFVVDHTCVVFCVQHLLKKSFNPKSYTKFQDW